MLYDWLLLGKVTLGHEYEFGLHFVRRLRAHGRALTRAQDEVDTARPLRVLLKLYAGAEWDLLWSTEGIVDDWQVEEGKFFTLAKKTDVDENARREMSLVLHIAHVGSSY